MTFESFFLHVTEGGGNNIIYSEKEIFLPGLTSEHHGESVECTDRQIAYSVRLLYVNAQVTDARGSLWSQRNIPI
jgi:hypothetical protein